MAEKVFVLHKEVIDIFNEKIITPTIEKLSFHLANVRILGSMEYEKTRNDCYHDIAPNNNIKLKTDYAEQFTKTTGIEILIQHQGGNRQISMEGIAVGYFPNSIDPDRIHIKVTTTNNMHVIHMLIYSIY